MNRSDLPEFVGYFCLFGAMSTLVAFYWLYASAQVRALPLFPGSTLPISWQWAMTGVGGLLSMLCAVALISRRPWAKAALIVQIAWGACGRWVLSNDGLVLQVLGLMMSALPLLIIFRVPIAPLQIRRRLSLTQHACRAVGMGFYGLAILMMYVTVMAQFSGTSPTATSPAMTSAGAIGYLIVALLVMWFGGAIWRDKDSARRIAGVLLIALASFQVLQCTLGYVYARAYYPQVQGFYHWDATLQSLVVLAIVGFTLVGLSRQR